MKYDLDDIYISPAVKDRWLNNLTTELMNLIKTKYPDLSPTEIPNEYLLEKGNKYYIACDIRKTRVKLEIRDEEWSFIK